jgi:GTPase SAR1 family protein
MDRATEMDITMIGLQNAGKTSLLRVLAVSTPTDPFNAITAQ